jgi:hypothetical protein
MVSQFNTLLLGELSFTSSMKETNIVSVTVRSQYYDTQRMQLMMT